MRTFVAALLPILAGCQSLDASVTATTATVTGGTPLPTETDTVTFVAIVIEENGTSADLNGGTLRDTAGATYAGFESTDNGGSYLATLTFEQINQVSAIDFAGASGRRDFVATFYDDDEDVVSTTLGVDLACRTADGLTAACGGVCVDAKQDVANCGACGHACQANETCVDGSCGTP